MVAGLNLDHLIHKMDQQAVEALVKKDQMDQACKGLLEEMELQLVLQDHLMSLAEVVETVVDTTLNNLAEVQILVEEEELQVNNPQLLQAQIEAVAEVEIMTFQFVHLRLAVQESLLLEFPEQQIYQSLLALILSPRV